MGTGLTPSMLRTVRKNVKTELNVLNASLDNMKNQIEQMNLNTWSGGAAANKWYSSANSAYKKDLKFYNKIVNIQNEMKEVQKKLDIAAKGSTSES